MPTRFCHAQGLPILIILDDLLNVAYSRKVCDLFTKGSHHRILSHFNYTKSISSRQAPQRHITQCQISK
jgi:hypothetical protein